MSNKQQKTNKTRTAMLFSLYKRTTSYLVLKAGVQPRRELRNATTVALHSSL
jgi:hypothetical protein